MSPNFVCQQSFFTLAVHTGLAANAPLRRLDPIVRPTLQRLAAQKPHLLDKPLLGRVPKLAVQVPYRANDRRQTVAKMRVRSQEGQKRFVADFHRRHGSEFRDCRILSLLHTT